MDAVSIQDSILGWIIRLAGLFWLLGALMLFRQIRMEMALDRMTARAGEIARDLGASPESAAPDPQDIEAWKDRDDAARRGWIAGQAVLLAATALAMLLLHPIAAWLAAALVMGQGVYFFWREHTARHAPSPEAAAHARPNRATVNAGWVSLFVAMLVWTAAFRGVLH